MSDAAAGTDQGQVINGEEEEVNKDFGVILSAVTSVVIRILVVSVTFYIFLSEIRVSDYFTDIFQRNEMF